MDTNNKELTIHGEDEMRNRANPWPKSVEELVSIINGLTEGEHDYGTCVYAMSLAAIAAHNYVAGKLGVSGFQSSCADLDTIKRSRSMKAPFMIVDLDKYLYPQYDLRGELNKFILNNTKWLKEQATLKLQSDNQVACKEVVDHWVELSKLP